MTISPAPGMERVGVGTATVDPERAIEAYRAAYAARDVEGLLDLFADDAEVVAVGRARFRGKPAIRKLFEWEARLSPAATIRDEGIGVLVSGRVAVWERVVLETFEGVRYSTPAVTVFELDDTGLIRSARAYYDRLSMMADVASGYPGVRGWLFRKLTGFLVSQGRKGLDVAGN